MTHQLLIPFKQLSKIPTSSLQIQKRCIQNSVIESRIVGSNLFLAQTMRIRSISYDDPETPNLKIATCSNRFPLKDKTGADDKQSIIFFYFIANCRLNSDGFLLFDADT
jgi:hypothetical protein